MQEKSKRPGRQFPVTFVVEQQLEACVDALTHNAESFNLEVKMPQRARDRQINGLKAALTASA